MMTIKFLIDECIGSKVNRWLIEQGFDSVSIIDLNRGAEDIDILHRACKDERIIITADKDFGDLVFKEKVSHCGIVLLRLRNSSAKYRIETLQEFLKNYIDKVHKSFIVITESGIRVIC